MMRRIVYLTAATVAATGLWPAGNGSQPEPIRPTPPPTTVVPFTFGAHDALQADLTENVFDD
jgi:hypothetical protein